VELSFHPNPSIRQAQKADFCIAGPQTTPHVVVQQLLQAGAERTVTPVLENGRYRLRTLSLRGGEYVRVANNGLSDITLRASKIDGWPEGEVVISGTPTIRLKNITDEEQLFILERLAWSDHAVTAAEVTVLQMFRDLFASEALRPGQQISVGSLAIVFTDLRGSTRLYNQIGDAPAFGLVMDHFDVLKEAINAEGGAIIKTIGDAVMAVFSRPAPALRAMLRAQAQFTDALGQHPVKLKAGIHYGPCIAVTLNDRLDYFGSTINKASRLEGFSSGEDVIISKAVYEDPEVDGLLHSGSFSAEVFETQIKGFDDQFALYRVMGHENIS
jgi:class 3 adenylate cyclase